MALSDNVKQLWETYDVRVFIMISLFIQFFLLFTAPFRKRTKNWIVISLIWLAYLLADWVATFVVGLILHGPVSPSTDTDLLVYWAPFLLVHLGGPDTITAFSFEDNELWARHLLQFVFQVGTTGYLFIQSLDTNKLMAPTLLIFLAGIIKYGERVRSLYLASLSRFRDSLLDDRPDVQEMEKKMLAVLDTGSKSYGFGDDVRLVKEAFCTFNFFQKLILDINFTLAERNRIRDYFLDITTAGEAFRIIEIELNLFYEVLYTKVIAFHQNLGYSLRHVSFSCILISLALWSLDVDKAGLEKVDVNITYTLIGGALALDIIASMGLAFSDWMVGYLLHEINIAPTTTTSGSTGLGEKPSAGSLMCSFRALILRKMMRLKKITWSGYSSSRRIPQRMLFNRWSESIPQYDLSSMSRYRKTVSNNMIKVFIVQALKYEYRTPFSDDLMLFIFQQLKEKADIARRKPDDAKKISSGRGEWILAHIDSHLHETFKPYTIDLEYDESLLHWYFATESLLDTGVLIDKHQQHCKVVGRYMVYLMTKEPTLMSTVAGIGENRFLDIYKNLREPRKLYDLFHKDEVEVAIKTKIQQLGQKKWEITSKVWLELLCFAAIQCRPRNLIAQVSNGGELITFVWSLMTHFGLGKQYRKQDAK